MSKVYGCASCFADVEEGESCKFCFPPAEPNLENQVKVRQQLIEEQKIMIKALSEDLYKIAHNSFELLLLAQIPASHSPEVADHMEICKAIVEQLTEKEDEKNTK